MSHFEELVRIVKTLRAPGGCPWDREQTFQSLTPYILEEAYELVDAIENGSIEDIKEELGDALLHVVMLSEIADEAKKFDVYDVADRANTKMIHRHPHVFGDTKVDSVDEVWKNWEKLKKEEKAETPYTLDAIPKRFPALLQAYKIQKKVSKLGFDWPDTNGPFEKMTEEIQELKHEYDTNKDNKERLEDEAGDVLFVMCNIIRKMGLNPEEALRKSNEKFTRRFNLMEDIAKDQEQPLSKLNLDELDALWNEAKKQLRA